MATTKDKIYEFKTTAVIPTAQYANIQPEVVGYGSTPEKARDDALKQLQTIWAMVGEGGKTLQVRGLQESDNSTPVVLDTLVCAFTGAKVPFDKANHKYPDGWVSGSKFASKFVKEFNADAIIPAFAQKYGVKEDDVREMWATNALASTSFGDAVHAALELYGKYLELSKKTKGDDSSAMHKNTILGNIVKAFYEGREKEKAIYEPFVADEKRKLCGSIDRLLVVNAEKKIVRIQDYKTNPDIYKKEQILEPFKAVVENNSLGKYWLQLSFYAEILKTAGYTVEGLDIFNWDGTEWVTYTNEVIDITPGL